jgi:hypothetical protein
MRALLIGALAATLVGCSCPLRQQAGVESCADANGLACLDRTAASQPIEPKPVLFKTNSAPAKSTMIAAKVEPPASRIPPSPRSLNTRLQPASNAAADSNATRANIADSHPAGGAVANSNTRTVQEQAAAAAAVAEQLTVATLFPAPEPKANNKDRSDHSETVLRGDVETTAPAQPNKMDLVYLLMARPEIKSVSDLTSKIIAIDDRFSASNGEVRIAIAAAGAPGVQLSNGQTKAIDRVISGEVPAAILTVVSPEAAEGFPDIAGFKVFRIPLSPRSLEARP